MYRALLILCVISFRAVASPAQEVALRARVVHEKVPLNRFAEVVIEASWQGPPAAVHLLPVEPPQVSNLVIVGTASANRVEPVPGGVRTVQTYRFTLKPESRGMAFIDEIRLAYRDSSGTEHALQTPRLRVEIVDPVPEPRGKVIHPGALWGTILAVLALLFGLAWQKRRARLLEQRRAQEQEKSLEDVYLEKLRSEISLTAEDLPAQYASISGLLRGYIRQTLGIDNVAATTQELLTALETRQISMEVRAAVQEVLQACDVVKFSGATAEASQLARLYTLTEDLIKNRKLLSGAIAASEKEMS